VTDQARLFGYNWESMSGRTTEQAPYTGHYLRNNTWDKREMQGSSIIEGGGR